MKVVVPLEKYVPAPLETMTSASAIDVAIQRKMRWRGVLRAEKGITLAISIKNIIRIIKSLENFGLLIDGVSKTANNKIKKGSLISWYVIGNFGTSILGNTLTGKRSNKSKKRI